MITVLIHWRIKLECEEEFLKFWSEKAIVKNRSGLIGEFLSKVAKDTPENPLPWITWKLDPENLEEAVIHYVNVGIWDDEKNFTKEIAYLFNDTAPLLSFEQDRRVRLLLRPERHRIGKALLPTNDSNGVI